MMNGLHIGLIMALIYGSTMFSLANAKHIFEVHEIERFSHKHLNNNLQKQLPKHTKLAYAQSTAHEVAALLAKTTDKYHPGAVAGKFSVRELLDLNEFNLDDCTLHVLEHRQSMCKNLASINKNLQQYCADCLRYFQDNCHLNRELVFKRAAKNLDQSHLRTITAFARQVLEIIKERDMQDSYDEAVRLVLSSEVNASQGSQVVSGCKEFNAAMADLYAADQGVDKRYNVNDVSLIMIYECCKIVVNK